MRAATTVLAVVGLLALVLAALFAWRVRAIASRVGSFECALRSGSRWLHGVAAYTHEALVWYKVASLSRRPSATWSRSELMIGDRLPRPPERGHALIEARCTYRGEELSLAAEPAAFDGLVSWLEAAPPGARSSGVI